MKNVCVCVSQYYEMSYGLNVEMHKQVTNSSCFLQSSLFGITACPHCSQCRALY